MGTVTPPTPLLISFLQVHILGLLRFIASQYFTIMRDLFSNSLADLENDNTADKNTNKNKTQQTKSISNSSEPISWYRTYGIESLRYSP